MALSLGLNLVSRRGGSSAANYDDTVFSLDNRASILPEIHPNAHVSHTVGAGSVLNSDDYYQLLDADVAKKTGARYAINLLAGVASSNNINDGNWAAANGASITSATTFTTSATNSLISSGVTGNQFVVGEKLVYRCRISLSSATAKIRFQLQESGGTTTSGTYQIIGTDTIEFSQSFTAIGDGTDSQFKIQCDTSGVTVTITNLQIENKTSYPTALQTVPSEYVDADTVHNVGVAGHKTFQTTNANSVDGNGVVTEALGTALTTMKGGLCQPERTNEYLRSRELTTAPNSTSGAGTFTANDRAGPDNKTGGVKIVQSGNNNAITQTITVAGGIASITRTISIFVYADTTFNFTIRVRGAGTTQEAENFTVSTTAGEWSQVDIEKVFTGAADGNDYVIFFYSDTVGDSNSRTLWFDMAQSENGTGVTNPIITAGAAVTRTATFDKKSLPSGLVNDFVLLLKVRFNQLQESANRKFIGDYTDSNNQLYVDLRSTTVLMDAKIAGTDYPSSVTITTDTTTIYDCRVVINSDVGKTLIFDGTAGSTNANTTDLVLSEELRLGYLSTPEITCNLSEIKIIEGKYTVAQAALL